MPNCLERHSLCTEANWGLPTQHFQKGTIVWVSIKNIKNKKKKLIIWCITFYYCTLWILCWLSNAFTLQNSIWFTLFKKKMIGGKWGSKKGDSHLKEGDECSGGRWGQKEGISLPKEGWLDVLRINVDLAVFPPYLDLEAGDNQSLKIQVTRPGIEPRTSCSASQELNHSATAAPPKEGDLTCMTKIIFQGSVCVCKRSNNSGDKACKRHLTADLLT